MKKKTIIFIAIAVLILAPVLPTIVKYTSGYLDVKNRINAVELPEGTEIVETKVSVSDVYGWHYLGESLVCTDMGIDELRDYVGAEDEDVAVFAVYKQHGHYTIEWDDWGINLRSIEGRESGHAHYYLIQVIG